MFLQHMVAVLKAGGVAATVMPHGILFRGGDEGKIRTKLLDHDVIDAVIGLPPNLFYGTGIPACIVVLRAPGSKPKERKGKVLFINADAEYSAGRAQNYLLPEHIEKITVAYREFADIPGYAAVVTRKTLADNDDNLNIRRYADNSPPPEPHDVRAHLHGGVPRAEIAAKAELFAAHGFEPMRVFVDRDESHVDFAPNLAKQDLAALVAEDPNVRSREAEVADALASWWTDHVKYLVELPATKSLVAARKALLDSFSEAILPIGILDRFQTAGVVVSWWDTIQYDLRTLAARGFADVIDGWVTSVLTGADDRTTRSDPLEHKVVRALIPSYLEELAAAEARRSDLEAQLRAALGSHDDDEETEDVDQLSAEELADLKKRVAIARKEHRDVLGRFAEALEAAREALTPSQEQDLVLRLILADLTTQLDAYVAKHRQQVVTALATWWDKYAVSLRTIDDERAATEARLHAFLRELGYA